MRATLIEHRAVLALFQVLVTSMLIWSSYRRAQKLRIGAPADFVLSSKRHHVGRRLLYPAEFLARSVGPAILSSSNSSSASAAAFGPPAAAKAAATCSAPAFLLMA